MKSTIKKISMILTGLLFSMVLCAQVAVTVDNTPGNLKNNLADKDPGSIVSLTITGTMDARDFKTMRDEMPQLVNIDLRQATIVAYRGAGGTYPPEYGTDMPYDNGAIPFLAFAPYGTPTNNTLKSVQIPSNTLVIGRSAFERCTALSSFTVPSSVTFISGSTFYGCSGLTSINIPSSVILIGDASFSGCTSLTEIVLPTGITEISEYLFQHCTSLASVQISSGVRAIKNNAFEGCSSLTSINIPSTVTAIETSAFEGCSALTSIILPQALTLMGEQAFASNSSLTGLLVIPAGIKTIEQRTFHNCRKLTAVEFSTGLDSIKASAFDGCMALSGNLTLPSTLRYVGERAFANCRSLNGMLTLPPHLTTIESFAFVDCRSLSAMVVQNPYPVPLIDTYAVFEGVDKSIPVQVPYGSKELYAQSYGWMDFTNITEDSQGMLLMGTSASFGSEGGTNSTINLKANVAWTAASDQAWLTVSPSSGNNGTVLTLAAQTNQGMAPRTGTITFTANGISPQSIRVTQDAVPFVIHTTTGNFRSAFTDEQYNTITRLTITGTMNAQDIKDLKEMPVLSVVDMSGVSITPFYYKLYKDMYSLPANSFPGGEDSYTGIYSMRYDSSLTSIVLPSNLERIEAEAFKGCVNLHTIVFPSSLTYIGNYAFLNCTGLNTVKLSPSVLQLGYGAFQSCSQLSSVVLSEGITELSATFKGCTSLRKIELPSTLKTIGYSAFQGCTSLTQIEIPSLVTTIETSAFYECKGLTSLVLPSSVTTISNDAFARCSGLNTVTLSRSLSTIGAGAFAYCSNLKSLYCYAVLPPKTIEYDNGSIFWNVDLKYCTLYVPYGSGQLYEQADPWKGFENIVEMDQFILPVTSIILEAEQGSASLAVTSATAWTATSDQSWLTIAPASGTGSATLTLTAEANPTFALRNARVVFTINNDQEQDITVTQKGIPATIELTAGNLSSEFSLDELIGMTRLSITGTIDARDFKTIRDRMPSLTELDISAATIAAYKGFDGTVAAYLYEPGQYDANGYYYPANEIPPYALYNGEYDNSERKIIRSIHLPDSLQSIGTYAFYRLTQLDTMIIPPAVTSIGSNAFAGTSSLTTVVLPPKLRHFPIYLFYNSGLTSINIPPAVTFIGYLAFGNCKNLTTVYSNALFPPEADLDYNFQGAPMFGLDKSNITLYVPYGARGAYAAAPNEWKEFTNVVELPGFRLSAAILAVKAAQGSTAKAAIQSDVQWTATSDQSWLAVSPSSGTGADSITFNAQANTMDAGRKATVIISAPDVVSQTITVIQEGKPRTIALTPGNMASVLTSEEMSGITNLTITGVMDARDFRIMKDQMPLLTYLDMSKVKIAEFQEPDPITGEIFTNRVNMIPNGAFFDQKTWKGKTSLTEVIFPQTLEKIGLRAFSNAAGLTVLRFPFTMRYIEMNAFNNCPYVTSIYSYALAPPPSHDWGTSFYNVDKTNCILYVPYGSKELYAASQWWKDFQNIVEMAEFKIMTSKATMKATRDIVRMRIQSQVAWTAEPSEEWLTVNPASGNDDQAITITAEANPTDILRTGTVTFRATGYLPQIFTVTQEGLPKPVNLTAGNLASLFTPEELKQITSLVITGTMDARDFKVIRDQMPWLGYLDLTGVTITAYSGNEGTYYGDYNYPANAIPPYALHTDNQSIPSRLSEILLPSSLALIDNQAFGSSVLTSLIIPPSVTSIGKGAFSYSMRLKEMTIPPSVTALEESLFAGCTGLTAVTLPSSLLSIGNYAFQDCDSLKELLIPSSVESIGEGAFFGCKSLSTVALPSSITTLRESLFQDCFSLTSITIPASVTSVGRFVFFNCSRLDSITLPSSLTLLDEGIFVGCTNLKTFIVPPMVTTIGSREFVNCTNLVSVSIPESVSAIGIVAFEGCINLTSIYVFRADPPQLEGVYKVFDKVNYSHCTLYVPYGSRLNYATANEWKDFKNIVEMAENQLWPIDAKALTTGADVKKTDVEMKCYPNPFTDQMTIEIANPSRKAVSVEIYSLIGQKVKTLAMAQKGAKISLDWNGKDEQGKQVPAGMFLLKVNEETRKVMKE